MKLKYLLLILFSVNVCCSISYSQAASSVSESVNLDMQKKLEPISTKLLFNSNSKIPSFLKFKTEYQPIFKDFLSWFKELMTLDKNFDLKLLTQENDQIGFTHYRYQQIYKGLLVENSMYLIHVKNGKIVSMNGLLFDNFNPLGSTGVLESDALKTALSYMNAKMYIWDDPISEQQLKSEQHDVYATWYPKGELVYIAPSYSTNPSEYKLSYKFDIYAVEPLNHQYVYIDAVSNGVVTHLDRIHTSDTLVTAKTGYSGTRRIVANYYKANSFDLREYTRGKGIETRDLNTSTYFFDADTTWDNVNSNKDQYGPDVHFGVEKSYDYYKTYYNRNSIDDSGFKIISWVHYGSNYAGAFWDGKRMAFGDGNGSSIKPMTTLDIVGHEVTHGLTQYTARLMYMYESGALNESFSDCLGTAIEWYADSTRFEWNEGEKTGNIFRSMKNPKSKNHPDTYKGKNWYVGMADNGGVHTNSSVQNHWFYLLSTGDTGTNDNGDYFSVDSIGIWNAGAIAYRTLAYYLFYSAQFNDARMFSIQAAEDLFGSCSKEMLAVASAWHAVGVGAEITNKTTVATVQTSQKEIEQGSVNNEVLCIRITPPCNATDSIIAFNFNTTGTTNLSNIVNAKVWYTGASNIFRTTTQFGQTVSSPSANFTITGTQKLNLNDDHYFWLSYDVAPNAVARGNYVDAGCDSLKVEQVTYIPDTINPFGKRKIYYCIPPPTLFPCQHGYISQVRISSINNKSGCDSSAYSDFSKLVTTNYVGQNIYYYVATSFKNLYINIWVDFDNNGLFDSLEWVVINKYSVKNEVSGTFAIPSSVTFGTFQIRVKADRTYYTNNSWPCATSFYGETEDYKVKVIPVLPKAFIIGDSVITTCVGAPQIFTTNYDTGYYYYWYKNSNILLDSGKGPLHDSLYYNSFFAGTDTITVKVIDSYNQNVVSNQIKVHYMPKPVAGNLNISSDSICIGDSISLTLSASAGNPVWQYYANNAWSNMVSFANSNYIFPSASTNYRAVLTSAFCNNDTTNTVDIIVNPNPRAGIASTSNSNICLGKSADLDLKGNIGDIDWQYYNDSSWSSIGDSNSIVVSPSRKTNYRAIVSNTCGVDTSQVVSIGIFPNPTSTITPGGPRIFCDGDSITLFAKYASAYKWNTGDTSRMVTITQSAFLDVTITDANGCEAKSALNKYTFGSPPTPSLVQQHDTLFVFPLGASKYAWRNNGNVIAVTKENFILLQMKGTYDVIYIDYLGCVSKQYVSYNYTEINSVKNVKSNIQVYPNPSDGVYNINANIQAAKVLLKVTDITGKLLLGEYYNTVNGVLNTSIDLSKFSHGIYLLYMESENGTSIIVKLVRE